jgi:hypothetical protein
LSLRGFALWLRGYPGHARADIAGALGNAREIGHAATLMYALTNAAMVHIQLGCYQEANSLIDEVAVLAEQTDAPFWKAVGIGHRGCIFSLRGILRLQLTRSPPQLQYGIQREQHYG